MLKPRSLWSFALIDFSSEIVISWGQIQFILLCYHLKPMCVLSPLIIMMSTSTSCLLFLTFNLFWAAIVATTTSLTRLVGLTEPVRRHVIFRVVKVAHGSIAFLLCSTVFTLMLLSGQEPSAYITQGIMMVSLSYYFFDLVFAFWMHMAYPSLVIHHVLTIIQIFGWFNLPAWLYFSSMTLFEVSVAPMNLREILRHLDLRYTKLFVLTEKAFFYSILVARGIFLVPVVIIPIFLHDQVSLFLKVNAGVIVALSLYFCSTIFKKMRSRWSEQREMFNKGVELGWLDTDESALKTLSFLSGKEERQI